MTQDIWKLFPKLLEERINALLDDAEPNRMKAFHLYKSCQNENLWSESFEMFSDHLRTFFALPKSERSKGQIDYYLNRPMHKSLYEEFQLDFRSAQISHNSVMSLTSWTHHLMRHNCVVNSQIISLDVLKKTFNYITNPPPFEKASDIEFGDFCSAWKHIVLALFGNQHEQELSLILTQLRELQNEQMLLENEDRFIPTLFLTQTEVDWVNMLFTAAEDNKIAPKFPLLKGPQKKELIELDKVVKLYNIVMFTTRPELIAHRSNVRTTLIYRCQEIKSSIPKYP